MNMLAHRNSDEYYYHAPTPPRANWRESHRRVLPSIHHQPAHRPWRSTASSLDRQPPELPDTIVFTVPHALRFPQANRQLERSLSAGSSDRQYYSHHHHHHDHHDQSDVNHSPSTSVHSSASAPEPSYASDMAVQPRTRTSRYLREMDRREIVARLDRGEKQAQLAREFNVSRSTVSSIFKQRELILARADENPYSRHPKARSLPSHLHSDDEMMEP